MRCMKFAKCVVDRGYIVGDCFDVIDRRRTESFRLLVRGNILLSDISIRYPMVFEPASEPVCEVMRETQIMGERSGHSPEFGGFCSV